MNAAQIALAAVGAFISPAMIWACFTCPRAAEEG